MAQITRLRRATMQKQSLCGQNVNGLQWLKQAIVAFWPARGYRVESSVMAHSGHVRRVAPDSSIDVGAAPRAAISGHGAVMVRSWQAGQVATYYAVKIRYRNNICRSNKIYLTVARCACSDCALHTSTLVHTLVPTLATTLYRSAQDSVIMHKYSNNDPLGFAYKVAGQFMTGNCSGMCQSVYDCHNSVQMSKNVALDILC